MHFSPSRKNRSIPHFIKSNTLAFVVSIYNLKKPLIWRHILGRSHVLLTYHVRHSFNLLIAIICTLPVPLKTCILMQDFRTLFSVSLGKSVIPPMGNVWNQCRLSRAIIWPLSHYGSWGYISNVFGENKVYYGYGQYS